MSDAQPAERRKRVLVVDDEEDVRLLLRHVLTDTGHDVDVAEDGDEAIRKLGEVRPDLLILDLMMPGTDGWGVLAHLRGMPDPPPVLLVTARGDEEAFTDGVRAGAAGYIAKPFHFKDLIVACRRVLERPSEPMGEERRRLPRRDLMVKVKVLSKDRAPMALGELVNLSPNGAQVDLIVPLDLGTHVRVALHISAADVRLKFDGRVQWRKPTAAGEGFAHGLEFVDVGPELRERLRMLLEPPA